MARKSDAVKALEKALQQLKEQQASPGAATAARSSAGGTDKRTDYLIKESRRFGDSLIAFYESEKNRAQSFLDTLQAIESGTYAPKRGGGRKGAGRKKNPSHKEAMDAGDKKDKK